VTKIVPPEGREAARRSQGEAGLEKWVSPGGLILRFLLGSLPSRGSLWQSGWEAQASWTTIETAIDDEDL
jgi:hypothetical protein